MNTTTEVTGLCPNCRADVSLAERSLVGEIYICRACESVLEVADLDPPRLEPAARVEDVEEG